MRALIITDLQNDFCPGGALAVQGGDAIVPLVNQLLTQFDLVVATQDWHPPHHCSFAATHPGRQIGDVIEIAGLSQILWPVHCVAQTWGAELHPRLDRVHLAACFRKGVDPQLDSYSGFFDNGHRQATGLDAYLRDRAVTDVYLCGLTTEYCVKATALDAVACGFRTHLLQPAVRGVGLQPNDVAQAFAEMAAHGVEILDEVR